LGFRYGFKANANRIALKVRERMGLAPEAPIDPLEICALFEIEVIGLSSLSCDASVFLGAESSAFSAMTVPCGLHTAIVHNDSHRPNRQRSNICHELGHCLLGHQCTPPLTPSGDRARDGGIEAEANFVGGTLLISNEAAHHILREGMSPGEAQREYGVSAEMLTYRLRVSGAYIVASRARRRG